MNRENSIQVKIMDLANFRSNEPKRKPGLEQHNLFRTPVFEATPLYGAFKDTVWVEDLPLGRLCLTHLVPRTLEKGGTVIGEGYQSLFSIPLPGAPQSVLEPPVKGITYGRTTKYDRSSQPVLPLVIPSGP